MATYYLLKTTGLSGGVTRTWTVPAGKVAVAVRCYGGGSGPRSGYHYAGGGGAFAYNTISSGGAGTVFHYYVGVSGYNGNSSGHTLGNGGGGNTWFGATTFAGAICAANGANLSPGSSGPAPWGADYHGGAASTSIGSVKFNGGYGGNNPNTSNGGGGCAGPSGPGAHGGKGYNNKGLGGGGGANNGHAGYNASSSSQIGGAGGASGNGGTGGAGGSSGHAPTNPTNGGGGGGASYASGGTPSTSGAAGTSGWATGYGPGGGGGGYANGAMFGGGAGGASAVNKTAGQGGIVVKVTDPPVILNAATGSFVLTGEPVSIHAARVLPGGPATGHFTLTGEPVAFNADISLRLPWLFTVTFGGSPNPPPLPIGGGGGGQGAADVLGAGYAGFNVFGQAVALNKNLGLTAALGSFALDGEAATLNIGHAFAVADGSFSLTGKTVGLADILSHALIAQRGSFALTGENAGTKWGPKFTAATGDFALTGGAATLSARSAFILPAGVGHVAMTGEPVNLHVGRRFVVGAGAVALAGGAVALSAHDPIAIGGTPITSGTVGSAANFTVTAKSGVAPYRYSIFAGALPPGQSLNPATGAVTGTLTTAGTFSSIVIAATDAIGATANLAAYQVKVSPAGVVVAVRFGDQTRAGAGGVAVTGTTITAGDPKGAFQILAGLLSLTAKGVGLPNAPYVLTLNDGSTVNVAKDAGAWDIASQQDWDNQAAVWSNGKTQWGQDAAPMDAGGNPAVIAVNAYANLQFTANPSSGTVTIAGHVYTPAINSSAAATATALAAQINALPDPNVTAAYSLGTSGQAPTVTVTAIASGTAGNNLALSSKLPVLASGAQNAAANVQSGQTLFIRSGAVIGYHGKLQNLSFASPVSVISRDLNRLQAAAFPHQPWGTLPALTGLATFIDDNAEISGAGTRLVIQGMRFAPSPMTRLFLAGSTSLAIDWNLFEGVPYDPTAYTNGAGQAAGQFPNYGDVIITNGLTNQNLAITNNWFSMVGHGVIATPAPGGTLTITGNVVDGWYNGAFQVGYPGAPFTFTFTDNCIARCASLAADRNNPHSNPLHVTTANPPAGSTLALNVQRNRMWTGTARGNDWAMRFESAPETGLVYSGSVIGNVMAELASGSNHLEFISTNGMRLLNNTVVGTAVSEEFPIVINWEAGGTVTAATVSTKNVAELISLEAPDTETHDVQLGALGATISYASAFAGSSFNPPDLATLMTAFAMKAGGPLDVGAADGTGIGVGAIGSGAVTWASTCPGSDGTSHVA